MSQAALRPTPATSHIRTVEAAFHVTAPDGPLSSPEALLAAVRAEILPALSDVLETPPFATSTITVPQIEIDIGTWPDPPHWPDVRLYLAQKLRDALMPYLPTARETILRPVADTPVAENTAPSDASFATSTAFLDGLRLLQPTDQLAVLLAHVAGHPARATALRNALKTAPTLRKSLSETLASLSKDDGFRGETASLDATIDAWAQDPMAAMKQQPLIVPDGTGSTHNVTEFQDALALHQGLAPLAQQPGPAQLAGLARFVAETPDIQRVLARTSATQIMRRLAPATRTALDTFQRQLAGPEDDAKATSQTDLNPKQPTDYPTSTTSERLADIRPEKMEEADQTGSKQGISTRNSLNSSESSPSNSPRTPDRAADFLTQLAAQPKSVQMPALLRYLADTPDALSTLQQPALRPTLQLGVPDVQAALTPTSGQSTRAETARQLVQVVNDSQTQTSSDQGAPQTAADWHARAMALAPDLVHALTARRINALRDALMDAGLASDAARHAADVLATQESLSGSGAALRDRLKVAGLESATAAQIAALPQNLRRSLEQAAPPKTSEQAASETRIQQALIARGQTAPEAKTTAARLTAIWSLLAPSGPVELPTNDVSLTALAQKLSLTARPNQTPSAASPKTSTDPPPRSTSEEKDPATRATQAQTPSDAGPTSTQDKPDDLRHLWRAAPAQRTTLLASLSQRDLRALALNLVPEQAGALRARMGTFLDDPETQIHSIKDAVAALLDGRALDFEALAAPPSLPSAIAALTNIDVAKSDPAAPLPEDLQRLLDTALNADIQMILRQIWAAWPGRTATATSLHTDTQSRTRPSDNTIGDAQGTAASVPSTPSGTDASETPRYEADPLWDILLGTLVDPPPSGPRTEVLRALLAQIEPDPEALTTQLRIVSARLALIDPKGNRAAQLAARQVVEAILAPEASPSTPTTGPEPMTRIATDIAGLVIVHPYIALLFERLGIKPENKKLPFDLLPKALAILNTIAPSQQGNDPLQKLLLGLPDDAPLPAQPEPLPPEAQEMIDGLLRAVITQWGRLGATSPDGLRETFLQRDGTLEHTDEAVTLRVMPGPFDMLMDGLPWVLSPVKLPWMPLPVHVEWRDQDV